MIDVHTRGEQGAESLAVPPPRDLGLLAVAIAGVSASGPLMAATAAPALAIAFWRNCLGALLTCLPALRRWRALGEIGLRAWLTAGIAGVFLSLHFATWVPSVKYTAVASATALVSTQAIFSGLISAAGGRRLPSRAWLGMLIAVVGTALVAGADLSVSGRALTGDGLAVLGAIFAAAYVTAGSSARRSMSAAAYTWVCYGVCAAVLLVVCLIGGQPLHGYSTRAWLLIAAVTVCAQLLGHTLLNVVLRSVSPTFLSLSILFETPGAAVIAAIWLHQRPRPLAAVGLIILFAGLITVTRSRPAERSEPESGSEVSGRVPVDLDLD